jgi:hypothetical protein
MKGFKTLIVAVGVAAIGLLEQFDVTTIVPDKYDGLALAGVGVIMAALRLITNTPVGKK